MEKSVGIGSKVPFAIAVDENTMGDNTLRDVSFTVKFYAKDRRNSIVTHICELTKAQCTPDPDDPNIYHVVVDTTDLDTGVLAAVLEVAYTDALTQDEVKEDIPLTSDILLVEKLKVQTPDYDGKASVAVTPASLSTAIEASLDAGEGLYKTKLFKLPRGCTLYITPHSPVPFGAFVGIRDGNGNAVQVDHGGPSGVDYTATEDITLCLIANGESAIFDISIQDASETAVTMNYEGTLQCTTEVTGVSGDYNVLWSSSDNEVVTVDSAGLVTNVSTGQNSAVVTAYVLNEYKKAVAVQSFNVYTVRV